jgi:P4 family phage/plasmid primase-like protien
VTQDITTQPNKSSAKAARKKWMGAGRVKPAKPVAKNRASKPSPSGPRLVTEEPRPWYEKFRIPADLINEAQVLRIDDRRARREYELKAPKLWNLSGIVFPYLHRMTGSRVYCRVRRDEYSSEGEDKKYIGNSAKQTQFERILYSASGAQERLERKRTTRILVEAEKSVLAVEAWARRAERTDIVPLGMGGCNGWRDKQHGVLPDLGRACDGSPVVIMLDANVATNKEVHEAQLALIAELRSRGCTVTVARLPQEKGINGPDDLLAQPDGDARFAEVLRTAEGTAVAPYSEHGLADRFATEHKTKAFYVPNIGWHMWNEQRWLPDDQGKVELLCQHLSSTAASERAKLSEQQRLRSRRTREAIMRESQAQLVIKSDLLDKDVMLLNTPGGTVDLRTGDLRPARPEDYCTKMAGATPDSKKPERWLQFIEEITAGDKALGVYLQRIAGLCLTGDVSMQEVYFLHGTGANGKSVFVTTLLNILGDYGRTTPAETLMVTYHPQHATSIAALRGARLVAVSEVEDGSRWAESKLKELTGGTPITARFMRMDEFTYLPQFKLVITGNHKPRLRNVDHAAERRLRLVPFTVQIPKDKRDRDLPKKLKPEYGGILQWAVQGCLDWQREGLGTPNSVLSASAEYLEAQDVLGTWMEEWTHKAKSLKVQSSVLYRSYKGWCEAAGEYVMTQREFTEKMKNEKGFEAKKSHGVMIFRGIGLHPPPNMQGQKWA